MTSDGYLQREAGGRYTGRIRIFGVDLSPVEGVYFKDKGKSYLYIKRQPMKEYDEKTYTFVDRPRRPSWEVCMSKNTKEGGIAYSGTFTFLRIRYRIVGMWDSVLGTEKSRLNLYIERLADEEQTIIQGIRHAREQKR